MNEQIGHDGTLSGSSTSRRQVLRGLGAAGLAVAGLAAALLAAEATARGLQVA